MIVVLTLGDVNLGCRHETFDPYRLVFDTGAVWAKALAVATVMGDARIRQRPRNRHLDVGGETIDLPRGALLALFGYTYRRRSLPNLTAPSGSQSLPTDDD